MKGSRRPDNGISPGGTLVAPGTGSRPAISGVQKLALAAAAIGLLSASAWLSVPFFPVPLTMQTLAVLLVGGLLGPKLGASSVAGYIALGAAGAPVFHNGLGGPAVLAGPTGGYLVGFIAAAFLMGLAAKWAGRLGGNAGVQDARSASPSGSASAPGSVSLCGPVTLPGSATARGPASLLILAGGALAASAAIYAVGIPWLALFVGDLRIAITVGAVPFLLGDLLKAAVAIAALRLGRDFLARRGLSLS